ncbi:two-component sensor histidine kinase [Spirosoma oryzae]|uniref:histidine kinase n=1 Tax=Spirosoma oryzae TaxID=1469603 RepID=A0A2T0TBS4_9BACT|nr:sensor histidine kinase [Spirosoma oryzae]PRY43113.1 two-component sensor histidine kinase [Spirosoma oryzae]
MKGIRLLVALLLVAQASLLRAQSARVVLDSIRARPDTVQIKTCRRFADRFVDQGQFDTADSVMQRALELATQNGKPGVLGKVYRSLGYVAKQREEYARALTYFQRAITLQRRANNHEEISALLVMIGHIYERIGDEVNRGKYYQAGLAEARRYRLVEAEADALSNLANFNDNPAHRAESLAYSAKALQLYKQINDDWGYHVLLLNRAITQKNAGQLNESERAYRECLRWADKVNEPAIKDHVYINLPNTLLLLNRLAEAKRYAKLGLERAPHSSEPINIHKEAYDVLTRIAEKEGDYRQALAYHRQYALFRDSVQTAEKSKQLIDAETRYQTAQKQARISQLATDNERQKHQLWALVGGTALLLLLVGILYGQYRIIRKTNAQLADTNRVVSENNAQISKQADQLKTLMQELHHRVKNNLSIISSLLRLQSSRLQDKGAAQAVLDGQLRVEAMALIHHRLYQGTDVSRLNMQDYIGELAHELMRAYDFTPDAVDLERNVMPLQLDVDVAIPVGLILNELLTNAFKYAYHSVERPYLLINFGTVNDGADTEGQLALRLIVQDNGPGIDTQLWGRGNSFGHRLIVSLSRQLGGTISVDSQRGTRFELFIPASEIWNRYNTKLTAL